MAFDKEEAYRTLQDLNTGQKTPVSLVMELATHLRTEASFEETSELKWNPNIFKYHAKLGNIRADGEGRSKKEAKQNSAQELLSIIQSYGSKFDRSSPQVGVFSPLKYSSPVSKIFTLPSMLVVSLRKFFLVKKRCGSGSELV